MRHTPEHRGAMSRISCHPPPPPHGTSLSSSPHLDEMLLISANAASSPHHPSPPHPPPPLLMLPSARRAMSNIESHPEGFNALRRMYTNVQEPLMDAAARAGGLHPSPPSAPHVDPSNPFAELFATPVVPAAGPSGVTPNPWAPSQPASRPAQTAAATGGGGGLGGGLGGFGGMGGMGGMEGMMNDPAAIEQMTQMMANPQVQQMMQDPGFLDMVRLSPPPIPPRKYRRKIRWFRPTPRVCCP